ncbi:chlorite dismutase family protein [Nocardioides convexus]|uniref:chlorite dismutase family protein n=1 Tax=Nocardioides convexus TaxID=2712224 RepID=UPI0024186D1D|nr:chlorite dismutase family protein [Nocardioides convexus]
MLAFEADDLTRIVDLMRHLRGSETRRHVREEVPFYTGRRVSLAEPGVPAALIAAVDQQQPGRRRGQPQSGQRDAQPLHEAQSDGVAVQEQGGGEHGVDRTGDGGHHADGEQHPAPPRRGTGPAERERAGHQRHQEGDGLHEARHPVRLGHLGPPGAGAGRRQVGVEGVGARQRCRRLEDRARGEQDQRPPHRGVAPCEHPPEGHAQAEQDRRDQVGDPEHVGIGLAGRGQAR